MNCVIGVAHADSAGGPFDACDEPLLRGGVIDPHVLVEEDGRGWRYWKHDANAEWPVLLCELLYREPSLITEVFREDADCRTASFSATLWPVLRTSRRWTSSS